MPEKHCGLLRGCVPHHFQLGLRAFVTKNRLALKDKAREAPRGGPHTSDEQRCHASKTVRGDLALIGNAL